MMEAYQQSIFYINPWIRLCLSAASAFAISLLNWDYRMNDFGLWVVEHKILLIAFFVIATVVAIFEIYNGYGDEEI